MVPNAATPSTWALYALKLELVENCVHLGSKAHPPHFPKSQAWELFQLLSMPSWSLIRIIAGNHITLNGGRTACLGFL